MVRLSSRYISSKSILLFLLEGTLMVVSVLLGIKLRFWTGRPEYEPLFLPIDFVFPAILFAGVFQLCFFYNDMYDLDVIRTRQTLVLNLAQSIGVASLILGVLYYIFPDLLLGRGIFFISTAILATTVIGSRIALEKAWQVAAPHQRLLILGSGQLAITVADELTRRSDLRARVVGLLSPSHCKPAAGTVAGHPILGSVEEVATVAALQRASRIIVALEDRRGVLPIRDLVSLRAKGVRVEDAQSMMAAITGRVWLSTVQPSWFVFSDGFRRSRLSAIVKRAFDLLFGTAGLVLSAPMMALTALIIRLDSTGPIIYRQTRVGLGGRRFNVLKFRSMRADAEANGAQWSPENDPRITRVGRFLRKFRIDELPQFLNVVRGDMSFVGPRPERPEFVGVLESEIAYYNERHSVRPGLTGWAQVRYKYGASREDAYRKLEYDLFYLKNMSLVFDLVIMLETAKIVLTGYSGR
jgi:sugar transferase (PEP-CTERM system associated)